MKQLKMMWGYYLTLLLADLVLVFPLYWIYKNVQYRLGTQSAVLALFGTVVVVAAFGLAGGVFTHRFARILRREIENSENQQLPERCKIIYVLKALRVEHNQRSRASEPKETAKRHVKFPYTFPTCPRKRRGKQSRFPDEKIWEAVWKWENRDPTFSVQTLEQFLEQEFGCGSDGILLMSPSSFYDYRRKILREFQQVQEDNPE